MASRGWPATRRDARGRPRGRYFAVFDFALVGFQGLRLPWCPRGVMAFKRPLKNKGIQEERVTTRHLDDLGQSTTLQSNKSPSSLCTTSASEAKRCLVRSLRYSSHKTLESNKSVTEKAILPRSAWDASAANATEASAKASVVRGRPCPPPRARRPFGLPQCERPPSVPARLHR